MDSTWDQFISNSSGWRAYRNCMHSRSPPGQTIQPLADELWYMESSWLLQEYYEEHCVLEYFEKMCNCITTFLIMEWRPRCVSFSVFSLPLVKSCSICMIIIPRHCHRYLFSKKSVVMPGNKAGSENVVNWCPNTDISPRSIPEIRKFLPT